jgi:glucuronokinase
VRDFAAEVELEPADRLELVAGEADRIEYRDYADLAHTLSVDGPYGGLRLLRGSLLRFARQHPQVAELDANDPLLRFRLRYRTDIPRQVGLSGSSAIVIATLRALGQWFEVPLDPHVLAELALAAEVEELGIAAGPMDRVIQAHEGLMLMDLKAPRSAGSYRRLDPALLPPLFVAWDPAPGIESGRLHSDVRARWLAGDPEVLQAMQSLREIVDRGVGCLETGDHAGFRKLMDQNFDIRARIFPMRDRDRELVQIGREAGAAVKFAGSGGAVVGALAESSDFERVQRAYRAAGIPAIRPTLEPA